MERPPLAAAHRDRFEDNCLGLDDENLLGWLVNLRLRHLTDLFVNRLMGPRQNRQWVLAMKDLVQRPT